MRITARWLSLVTAFAALAWSGGVATVSAAEEERGGPGDRLERLERRVNEMAQRQEQLLRRLGAQQESQGPAAMPGRERMRQQMPLPGLANVPQPPPGAIPPVPSGPLPAVPAAPKAGKAIADLLKLCLFVGFIFNILIAIWIFTDIRKRGEGSGIFIALALLAGIPTAIIYAIVRIGDRKM
jgi:hypothetical protein